MSKQSTMRNGTAVAAQHRNAGYMKHRNQPRGGARNVQVDYLDECEDYAEGEYCSRGDQERGYVRGR